MAVLRKTPEDTRYSQSQNTLDPKMAQEYISRVSDEIEQRVTKKLSEEFNRTASRILRALSKLDEFFLKPQVRTCSNGTSRSNDLENREPTGDHSPDNPRLEAVFFTYHSKNLNDSEQEETYHMLTRVHEEICYRPHNATGVQEEIPYCSPGTSSGIQKKAGSASQPQFRSGNTAATIEADQILLAL